MIKKLMLLVGLIAVLSMPVMAADVDTDGILGAAWDAPAVGNVPTGYALSYTINGVADSVGADVSGLKDSSVVLSGMGDWAVLNIRSYMSYWSNFNQDSIKVYSVVAVSDTVMFEEIIDIDPPTGIRWE